MKVSLLKPEMGSANQKIDSVLYPYLEKFQILENAHDCPGK